MSESSFQTDPVAPRKHGVLVLGPSPVETDFCVRVLADDGIHATPCGTLGALLSRSIFHTDAAIIPEECIIGSNEDGIAEWLSGQPTWSDFPIIVLLQKDQPGDDATQRLLRLGNVTFINRPVQIASLVSTVRAKVRDRRRQFKLRSFMRRRATKADAVRLERRRLQMALQSASAGAWQWTAESIYWDDHFFELLGYRRGEIPPHEKYFFDRVHPEDLLRIQTTWLDAQKDSTPFQFTCRILPRENEIRWLSVVGEPILGDDGHMIGFAGLGRDVTESQEAAIREKRQGQRDRFLAGASKAIGGSLDPDLILERFAASCAGPLADWAFFDILDPQGQPQRLQVKHAPHCNEDLLPLLSRVVADPTNLDHPPSHALFAGRSVLIPTVDLTEFIAQLDNPDHIEAVRRARPHSVIAVPLAIRGRTFGALTMLRTRNELSFDAFDLELAEELAARVSVAFDNAQLYRSAQRANAAKSEFLANMSHEIRTPMTSIIGYTELLIPDETEPQRAAHLSTVRRNGLYLLSLINDILDLSKIEAGKLELSYQPISLHGFIDEIRQLMEVRADENQTELIVDRADSVPDGIMSDPLRLKQILVNLIGNAIKFTAGGRVQFRIVGMLPDNHDDQSLSPDDSSVVSQGCWLRFEVIDNGIGMSDMQVSRLFRPFSQGDVSVSRRYGGTGLGLAITNRLVNMFDGAMEVTSELGVGSRFMFELPVVLSPPPKRTETSAETSPPLSVSDRSILNPPPRPQTDTEPTGPRLSRDGQPLRVLVVDDSDDIRFLSRHLLIRAGATVTEATDGVPAVAEVERSIRDQCVPDLILLDMQMPQMDGYLAVTKIRALGYQNPIIALTADAMVDDVRRSIEGGCNEHLSKPIHAAKLVQTIRRLCNLS